MKKPTPDALARLATSNLLAALGAMVVPSLSILPRRTVRVSLTPTQQKELLLLVCRAKLAISNVGPARKGG